MKLCYVSGAVSYKWTSHLHNHILPTWIFPAQLHFYTIYLFTICLQFWSRDASYFPMLCMVILPPQKHFFIKTLFTYLLPIKRFRLLLADRCFVGEVYIYLSETKGMTLHSYKMYLNNEMHMYTCMHCHCYIGTDEINGV